jgi:peptidoglycan-associated lipoprotein
MKTKKIQLLSAIFAFTLMVGCASTESDDEATNAANQAAQAAADQAAADKAAAEAAAKAAAEAAAANLQTVFYFGFDQATLSAETRAALDAQVAALKNLNTKIRLEGNTDDRGTREYNMALGERRANAVANYLIINGIERYRVETVSYGEERPVNPGNNEAAWAENRRVELK